MSSESTSPPHSPQKKALEEKNAVAHSTDSHSPAASTIGPKRARRISLDTFFQPMKPKRAKEEENENCTPDSNAVKDASVEREAAVVEDTKPKKVEEGCDASACEAQETATASADSEQEDDDDVMLVDEEEEKAALESDTAALAERRTTPARRPPRSRSGTSNDSGSPTTANSDVDQKTTPASGRRRLTPAEKLAREQEKERKRLEREAKVAERERQRLAEQEEKERRRQERERKRIEKEREVEEKRLEKEERERQRQQELLAKQEEKRKKEEEKRKKEEEKRLAEERRKQEEEAKKREEEAKQLKAHKQAITSFFKKVDPKPTQLCTVGPESSRFRPFQLKEGMRMASILRRTPLTDSERQSLDEHMINQTCEERLECVKKLRTKRLVGSRQSETTVVSKDDGDVRALNSPDTVGPRMKAKLIQFHDNCRPPYYGTWRKKSVFITGRRPYGQDKQLDYDVDSDEEWEDEPEDAEDCNSDDEDEAPQDGKEDPDEDDDDGFFVEHGYLSDGEGVSDEDDQCQDAETRRARMAAKAEAWKTDVRMEKERKSKKLLPFIIGPCWNYALLDHQLAAKLRPFKALRIGDGPLLTSYNRPQPPAVA